jgi:hypothetical protein
MANQNWHNKTIIKINKTKKMMKHTKIYGLGLLALAVLAISACSDVNDIKGPSSEGRTPICLRSSLLMLKSNLQNVQIANGQQLGFFVNDEAESTYSIENFELTADGNGSFTHSPLYYPTAGNSFAFTAYHPHKASVSNSTVEHSVLPAQNINANYLNSDLLYVKKTGIARTPMAIPLVFKHKLSRMTFIVKKGEGAEIHELNEIKITNVLPDVSLNLVDGSLSAASGAPISIVANGVAGGESGVESLSGGAAIVAPQTISADTELLQITIGGVSYIYTLPTALELEGGTSYAFEITVNMAGISVSSSITNWEDGESIEGEGIIA